VRSHGFQKAGRNDSYLGSQSKAQLAIELRHDYNFSLSYAGTGGDVLFILIDTEKQNLASPK